MPEPRVATPSLLLSLYSPFHVKLTNHSETADLLIFLFGFALWALAEEL